jgi:hypothetical protein
MSSTSSIDREAIDIHRRYAGRHIVGVIWEDAEPGESKPSDGFAFSGFILAAYGQWFLITAGHIIEDIQSRQQQGRELRHAKIMDVWAEGNVDRNPVPFPDIWDRNRTPRGHVNSEQIGYDYAWFFLRPYYRELLKKNGIIPLDRLAWRDLPSQLDGYYAYGFPQDCVQKTIDGAANYSGVRLRPRMIPYEPEPNPPAQFQLPLQRLFFRPPKYSDGRIVRLDGVSGGPVFGYKVNADHTRMWLVGVQSSQTDVSGLAIVCPAEPFGVAMETALDKVVREHKLGEDSQCG